MLSRYFQAPSNINEKQITHAFSWYPYLHRTECRHLQRLFHVCSCCGSYCSLRRPAATAVFVLFELFPPFLPVLPPRCPRGNPSRGCARSVDLGAHDGINRGPDVFHATSSIRYLVCPLEEVRLTSQSRRIHCIDERRICMEYFIRYTAVPA